VYHIELYQFLLYRGKPILRASQQVWQLLTGRITHDYQSAFVPRHPPRACNLIVHDTGECWGAGGERD